LKGFDRLPVGTPERREYASLTRFVEDHASTAAAPRVRRLLDLAGLGSTAPRGGAMFGSLSVPEGWVPLGAAR
jgi:hypothetical protein